MTATATPQLRRSKRKLASEATDPVSKATNDDAPAPAKRARKTTASTPESPPIQQESEPVASATMNTKPARPQQKPYTLPPFLALPRELRDEIYKQILCRDASNRLKSSSHNIVTRCGLVGVNAQISAEFLDAVLFHAPVITTTVRNHNFAPVVTFLNRLSAAQLNRLSSRRGGEEEQTHAAGVDDKKRKRKMRIILSYSAGARDSRAHLNRWLDRFDHPDKRGKEIEFEYGGDGTYMNGGRKQRPQYRARASERWNDEACKIRMAARGYDGMGWGWWKTNFG